MLISFTQTYGDERGELLEIQARDKRMLEFKDLFDWNIFSFHDCDSSIVEKFKSINKVKNSVILEFGQIYYPGTINEMIKIVKELGGTHFFFSQDDTFSANNDDIDWNELVEYIKGFKEKFMLNLYYDPDMIDHTLQPTQIKDTFNIYHLTSFDFKNVGVFSMDDSPYVCTVDMLDKIYDDDFIYKYDNVWDCELYLIEKFKRVEINRFILDKGTFKNYNLYGRSTHKKTTERAELQEKNMILRGGAVGSSPGS